MDGYSKLERRYFVELSEPELVALREVLYERGVHDRPIVFRLYRSLDDPLQAEPRPEVERST